MQRRSIRTAWLTACLPSWGAPSSLRRCAVVGGAPPRPYVNKYLPRPLTTLRRPPSIHHLSQRPPFSHLLPPAFHTFSIPLPLRLRLSGPCTSTFKPILLPWRLRKPETQAPRRSQQAVPHTFHCLTRTDSPNKHRFSQTLRTTRHPIESSL